MKPMKRTVEQTIDRFATDLTAILLRYVEQAVKRGLAERGLGRKPRKTATAVRGAPAASLSKSEPARRARREHVAVKGRENKKKRGASASAENQKSVEQLTLF